jgi:multidrug efflux pump subunit AcrA (membrane-fusion protein)
LANTENPEMAIAQAEQDVVNAKMALDAAQTNYDRAKDKYESNWTVKAWIMDYELKTAQLTIAELNLTDAEEALASVLADIEQEVAKKQKELAIVQGKLDDAQDALEEAQNELEEVQAASTKITAPFGGFITGVYVKKGDEVKKGTVAIELASAEEFEADILVNETDIFQVKLDGEAWVEVDALQGMNFPATVTRISPTATIQQGVVNYSVKVELQSLEAIAEEQQAARQEAMEGLAEGEMPEFLQRAIDAGMITEEQANEMLERMRSGEMRFQPGEGEMPFEWEEGEMPFEPGEGGMFFQQGEGEMQLPFSTEGRVTQSASLEDFQLREGLTVTVSIIVDERNDVLLVPNSAIITSGMRTYVRVISADGTIEERAVTTGISDWQYTEVTEGLNEGENVVVPTTTTSSSTTTTTQEGGTIRMPGIGGFGR